jgi:transposase
MTNREVIIMEQNILTTLFVGIDVDSQFNVIYMMDFKQNKLDSFRVKNDLNGATTIKDKALDILIKNKLTSVIFVMESTSIYAFHTATFLSSDASIIQYNPRVYCINPKITCNYRASFPDKDKDDLQDSHLLADLARVGRCDQMTPWRGAQFIALQRLTRHRKHLAQLLAGEKNYILCNIFLKFSGLCTTSSTDTPFSNLFGATSSFILTDFVSPEDIVNTPLEDLITILEAKSNHRFKDSEVTAKLLKQAAINSYRLDKVTLLPINLAITSSINCIRAFEHEMDAVSKEIASLTKGFNATEYLSLTSIKGIGPAIASGIIAEIGSIDQFRNDEALAKFAGITWRKTQSGKFEADDTPLTKTGNSYLRYYIIEAANQVRKYIPEYTEFYNRKMDESTTNKEMRAQVLTARKLIKLIYALMSTRTLYKER